MSSLVLELQTPLKIGLSLRDEENFRLGSPLHKENIKK